MAAANVLIYAGSAELDRASPAFTVGRNALDMGMSVTILVTTSWLCIVRRCGALGLSKLIALLNAGGARLIACPTDVEIADAPDPGLVDGFECGNAAAFADLARRADIVLAF
jgi:predicted peroxiredoxin